MSHCYYHPPYSQITHQQLEKLILRRIVHIIISKWIQSNPKKIQKEEQKVHHLNTHLKIQQNIQVYISGNASFGATNGKEVEH